MAFIIWISYQNFTFGQFFQPVNFVFPDEGDAATEAATAGPSAEAATAEPSASSSTESEALSDLSELPFQLQLTYTDLEGAKALRVVTQTKPITTERDVAEEREFLEKLNRQGLFK